MNRHLHLDFEVFSEEDLKRVGAYRYAYGKTEILTAAMALDDGEPVAWWQGMPDPLHSSLEPYWDALEDPDVLVYCHHAMFEMAICQALLQKTWNIKCPDLSRFRCTMSLARRACLPASLEKLGETLGLNAKKDNRGKALIKKFCIMQAAKKPTKKNQDGVPVRRILPTDEPEAFMELVEYCRQDVRAEQEVGRRLSYFDDPINNANYSLDARINARGVPVNVDGLRKAQKIIEEETELVSQRFRELVGFEVTQGARILAWVNQQGYAMENLQAETIRAFLKEDEEPLGDTGVVGQALRMKQSLAYAAPKKVQAMLDCVLPDSRIRGMLNYHGATTGRWTSSLVQLQNLKRSSGASEEAYKEICEGTSRDMLDCCYGSPLEVISSAIRHFVHDVGNPLNDADYAAIEARIVCWLAGQEDALQEYRDGVDRYKVMASVIYRITVEEVNKFPQRFVGKTSVLGMGFGLGATRFRASCMEMGYELPPGLEEIAVAAFRAKHPKVKQLWYSLEKAAKQAILKKGQVFKAGEHLSFKCMDIAGMPFLLMKLPSGRKLAYPRPQIKDDRIEVFGNIKGAMWGYISIWGGTFCENGCQGVAFDIMANGAHNAENAGYEIATLIHDQALAYHKEGQSSEEFVKLLTTLPAWADGLPIAAEGSLVSFYKKD